LRYLPFTKAAIKNDNAQVFDAEADRKFNASFTKGLRAYHKHLDKIAVRLGPTAHKFFRFGFAETGLHDGLLLSFSLGDRLASKEHPSKLRFGKGKSVVRIEVLNHEQNAVHVFECKRLHKVIVDIPSVDPLWFTPGGTVGQIYSYEIVALSAELLQLEWLLDSGGTITIDFEKLIYRRKNAKSQNARLRAR
jgi:hypothetical protein